MVFMVSLENNVVFGVSDLQISKKGESFQINFTKPPRYDIDLLFQNNFILIFELTKKRLFKINKVFSFKEPSNDIFITLNTKTATFFDYIRELSSHLNLEIKDGNIFIRHKNELFLEIIYTSRSTSSTSQFIVHKYLEDLDYIIQSIQMFLDIYYSVSNLSQKVIFAEGVATSDD